MKTLVKILDRLLLVVIFFSVVQLVVDDAAVVAGLNNPAFRFWMIVAGFAFDLIFTIEFFVRSLSSAAKKNFGNYILHQNGWVDFLAAVPLLLFNSGPMLVAELMTQTGGGERSMMNLLKVVRAVRVTRVLRLLRILKIFGKIENVGSKMAQKHVMVISSLLIMVSIVTYFVMTVTGFIPTHDPALEARFSLFLTTALISAVLSLALIYTAYFAQTVSDPVYIMQRGFSEEDYNLSVKILKPQTDTELFMLADSFNRLWLPLKVRLIDAHKAKERKAAKKSDDYSDLL